AHARVVELARKDLRSAALPLLALAVARGTTTGTDRPEYLWTVAVDAARVPPVLQTSTRDAWVELAPFVAIDGNAERAKVVLASLPDVVARSMIEPALARALVAGVAGDREALRAFATSPFPEAREIAEAELASDPAAQAAAW